MKERHITCFNVYSTIGKQCRFHRTQNGIITPKIKQVHVSLDTKKSSSQGACMKY